MKPTTLPAWRLLREPIVVAATGWIRATIRRHSKAGDFPKPVKIGTGQGGAIAWREDEILQWIEARQAGRTWTPGQTERAAG